MAEVALVFAILGGAIAALTLLLAAVPFQRWRFSHAGQEIEVVNYGVHERILVDGEVRRGTRTQGSHGAVAHEVVLRNGDRLEVRIVAEWTAVCTARVGDRVVFDSTGQSALAREPLPDADPRAVAARTLLDALRRSEDPRVATAAATLDAALRGAFERLATARAEAGAHAVLAGDADASGSALVEAHERQLTDLLGALRELHVAVAAPGPAEDVALPRVREVLDRVAAEREVARVGRRVPQT